MRYEIEIEANLGLEWKPVAFRAQKVGEHYYNVILGEPCPVSPTAPLAGACRLIVEKRPIELGVGKPSSVAAKRLLDRGREG